MKRKPLTPGLLKLVWLLNIGLGLSAAGFCAFSLLIVAVQKAMMRALPANKTLRPADFDRSMAILHDTWTIFMPLGLGLGLLLVYSGWLLKQSKDAGRILGLATAWGAVLWNLGYVLYLMPLMPDYLKSFSHFPLGETFLWIFMIFCAVLSMATTLSYPIFLIIVLRRPLPAGVDSA